MAFRIDPADALPIWKQIEDRMKGLVAGGTLGPGAPVPSVRELARELQVNPMTVSKAYQRLTESGVLEVRRGDGTYVSKEPPTLTRTARLAALREAAQRYAAAAVTLGATPEEAHKELAAIWPSGTKEKR
jgi:GntR family transcriptional regulator